MLIYIRTYANIKIEYVIPRIKYGTQYSKLLCIVASFSHSKWPIKMPIKNTKGGRNLEC